MSVEGMFEDLEGRMAHLEAEEMRTGAEELARAERARVGLIDRLRAALGLRIAVHIGPDHVVAGRLADVGAGWLLLGEDPDGGSRAIVPVDAAVLIEGLPARSREPESEIVPPRSLGSVLRQIGRERAHVSIHTAAGVVTGRVAAVGQDALDVSRDLASHAGRRRAAGSVAIPFAALRLVAVD